MSTAALARVLAQTDVGRRIAADVTERLRAQISQVLSGTSDLSRLGGTLPVLDLRGVTPPTLDATTRSLLQETLRSVTATTSSALAASVDWSHVGEPARRAIKQVVEASSRAHTSATSTGNAGPSTRASPDESDASAAARRGEVQHER